MVLAMMLGGCASRPAAVAERTTAVKPKPVAGEKKTAESEAIVTPQNLLVGKVSVYNTPGRFVVLDFPVGKMPVRDQTMFVYRQGLKVGEVRITGPERDHNTVGDLTSGEARKGDEVRDR
jgi:hypothetical protein